MRRVASALACCAVIAWLTVSPQLAFAHESRDVADGTYAMVVGFLSEPAYIGQPNGLDLKVTKYGGKPPTDLDQSLTVDVITGSNPPMALTLAPLGDGAWAGYFIPTVAGDYSFHISGTIEDQPVDETFTSSPNGFASVESTTDAAYPPLVTSTGPDVSAQIDAAQDDASSARTLGIIGIAVGAVGLVAALVALTLSRRTPTSSATDTSAPSSDSPGRLVR